MIVKPLQKYALLEVKEYNDPKSGIVVPTKKRKKKPIGKVVAKGEYCDDEYQVGDVVLFRKSGTKALPEDMVLCHERNILMKKIL